MLPVRLGTVLKLWTLFILISPLVTSKSIAKRDLNGEIVPVLDVENSEIKNQAPVNIEGQHEIREDTDEESNEDETDIMENEQSIQTGKRTQRTIGRLQEDDNPLIMIENFHKKLKEARDSLHEDIAARLAHPLRIQHPIGTPIINPSPETPEFELPQRPNLKPFLESPIPKTVIQHSEIPEANPANFNSENPNPKSAASIITSPIIDSPNEKKTDLTEKSSNKKDLHDETFFDPESSLPEAKEAIKVSEDPKMELDSEDAQRQNPIERKSESAEPSEEIQQLLLMRDEINRLRSIMQLLREHQMKKRNETHFINTQGLTDVQRVALEEFVKELKEKGQISSRPFAQQILNPDDTNQPSNEASNVNIEKLREDIKNLKDSINKFAVRIDSQQADEKNLEKLEHLIDRQREEIDALKSLVDKILPPNEFPASGTANIKHPNDEKKHLHQELKKLQDILNEIMEREETREKAMRASGSEAETEVKSSVRANPDPETNVKLNELNTKEKPKKGTQKSDEEIATLVKIFNSMAHPEQHRHSLESKIDQLQRDVKELDNINHRTRHEILIQKLENDIKDLKEAKSNPTTDEDIKEKITRLEEDIRLHHDPKKTDTSCQHCTMREQIKEMEKQIEKMTKPETRQLVTDGRIEKELDKLQKEIDELSEKAGKIQPVDKAKTEKPASKQMTDLFTSILSDTDDKMKEPSKQMNIQADDSNHGLPSATHELPNPSKPYAPAHQPNTVISQPNIFQLPFCLQKNPHFQQHPIINQPNHPYASVDPVKVVYETFQHHTQPIKPVKDSVPTPAMTNPQFQSFPPQQSGQNFPKPAQPPMLITYKKMPQQPSVKPEVQQTLQPQNQREYYAPSTNDGYSGKQQNPIYSQQQPTENFKKFMPQQNTYTPQFNQGYQSHQYKGSHPIYDSIYLYPQAKRIEVIPTYKPEVPQQHQQQQQIQESSYPQQISDDYEEKYKSPEQHSEVHFQEDSDEHHNYESSNMDEGIKKLNGVIGMLDEKLYPHAQQESNSEDYHRNRRSIDEDDIKNMRERLAHLKDHIQKIQDSQTVPNSAENEIANPNFDQMSARTAYVDGQNYYQPYSPKEITQRKQKFDNLFIKIVKFILHKLEISAPYIVESLFDGDVNYFESNYPENGYSNYRNVGNPDEENFQNGGFNGGSQNRNVGGFLNNFQGFNGLLGIIPTILFKLLSNFSSFLNVLKRNNFFKNFLFPGALILVVDGIMALLVWWFSDDSQNIPPLINNLTNNNQGVTTYNPSYNQQYYTNPTQ